MFYAWTLQPPEETLRCKQVHNSRAFSFVARYEAYDFDKLRDFVGEGFGLGASTIGAYGARLPSHPAPQMYEPIRALLFPERRALFIHCSVRLVIGIAVW